MKYNLPTPNNINGDQLEEEISTVIGREVIVDFLPPNEVFVHNDDNEEVTIQTIINNHDPLKLDQITKEEFMDRFPAEKQQLILTSTDMGVLRFLKALDFHQGLVNPKSQRVSQGLSYFIAKNILTQAEADFIQNGA